MDGRVFVRVQKLDRVLNRYDVVVMHLVDEVYDGGECGTLAAARWSSDEHDAILEIYYLFQLFRQIEIAELRRLHRNDAHDDRVAAALLEDIDTEASVAGNAERQVSGAGFL